MKGTVKWFNGKKGYGFIKGDDGQDYFVHFTSLPRGTFINEDDSVKFDPVETDKGVQAQNVVKMGGQSAPEEAPSEDEEEIQPLE